MGVVYKARDTRLDRFVAIKTLSAETLTDPERRSRFAREARAASALNHPGIITIHDIATEDGIDFIAMEYIHGKTLDQLIGRKGLSLKDTLNYAIQAAEALAKAHEAGIVHRDLKPSNIMVTDGRVKILDFGVAKLTWLEPGEVEIDARTVTATATVENTRLTGAGKIVGTAAYMSPEQAAGRESRLTLGRLQLRRGALRDGHRREGVQGRHVRLDSGRGAECPIRSRRANSSRTSRPTSNGSSCAASERTPHDGFSSWPTWSSNSKKSGSNPARRSPHRRPARRRAWWRVALVPVVVMLAAGMWAAWPNPSRAAERHRHSPDHLSRRRKPAHPFPRRQSGRLRLERREAGQLGHLHYPAGRSEAAAADDRSCCRMGAGMVCGRHPDRVRP